MQALNAFHPSETRSTLPPSFHRQRLSRLKRDAKECEDIGRVEDDASAGGISALVQSAPNIA
ncbi:hypothetical protein RvY_03204 [Ramazzottius varieornatus]|uniref:Uncharacterized protein n=1 Tax=Ramazzottius varieornatus TaxID=947166 RepID=A0A1D1UT00_RAMVA|nr:hypothetical protein RvY_03204 [Ramazzottius varieornatus]